jgi:large subunit ribosomal protein L29
MSIEKIRNTTQAELLHQEREMSDQLFRLKFQLNMGQTESLNKIRELRKDIARVKTVLRERELGLNGKAAEATEAPAEKPAQKARAASAEGTKKTGKPAAKASAKKSEKK